MFIVVKFLQESWIIKKWSLDDNTFFKSECCKNMFWYHFMHVEPQRWRFQGCIYCNFYRLIFAVFSFFSYNEYRICFNFYKSRKIKFSFNQLIFSTAFFGRWYRKNNVFLFTSRNFTTQVIYWCFYLWIPSFFNFEKYLSHFLKIFFRLVGEVFIYLLTKIFRSFELIYLIFFFLYNKTVLFTFLKQ